MDKYNLKIAVIRVDERGFEIAECYSTKMTIPTQDRKGIEKVWKLMGELLNAVWDTFIITPDSNGE